MGTLATNQSWGSGPVIYFDFSYDHYRSGADMRYRVNITVHAIGGASYYGYPIKFDISVNNTTVTTGASIKSDFPTQWDEYTWSSDWFTVRNITSGKVPLGLSAYSANGSWRTGTWSYSMSVDPAGSKITAYNGTLGETNSISVTRYNSGFTHTIVATCGTDSQTVCTKSSATTVTWVPKLAFAKQAPSGSLVTVRLTCTTYSGSSQVGETSSVTVSMAIPSSVAPTATLVLSDPTGTRSKIGAYVQGLSTLRVRTNAAGAEGSTVTEITVAVAGVGNFTGADITTGLLPVSGSITVTVTVKDDRGRSGTVTATVTALAYQAPTCSVIDAMRCTATGAEQADGGYGKLVFTAQIAALNNHNTAKFVLQYRVSGTDAWTEVTLSGLANQYTVTDYSVIIPGAIAGNVAIEARILMVDSFREVTSATRAVPIGFMLAQTSKGGTGIAFGQQCTEDNRFIVALQAIFKGKFKLGHYSGLDIGDNGINLAEPTISPGLLNITAPKGLTVNGRAVGGGGAETGHDNNGGSWVKYSDGYMDVYRTLQFTDSIDLYSDYYGAYTQNDGTFINYPVKFVEPPMVQIQLIGIGCYLTFSLQESTNVSNLEYSPLIFANSKYSLSNAKFRIHVHAHGKYK